MHEFELVIFIRRHDVYLKITENILEMVPILIETNRPDIVESLLTG